VAKHLYHLNGTVYITSRSPATGNAAISSIVASKPSPTQVVKSGRGSLHFLKLNLSDLSAIKATASEFLAKEKRLDVIFHNAGVMLPDDPDAATVQGYHQQLGINALAPFLLQHFLTPLMLSTAAFPATKANSVRIIFVSSSGHRAAPRPDGVCWDDINLLKSEKTGLKREVERYGQSKAMNVMHAHEFARRYGDKGIVSFSLHPGALSTGLQKNAPGWFNAIFGLLRKEPRYGALTELFAGLVELNGEEKEERNGGYILPWGRWSKASKDIVEGLVKRESGDRLWRLCEGILENYM
jgi:NAD(P)-dependent dehydrogenase (short-subunit alcohol dehydrogenase family)